MGIARIVLVSIRFCIKETDIVGCPMSFDLLMIAVDECLKFFE